MVIRKFLKEKKGILVSDAIVAVLMILVFAGLIATLMTNIYKESAKVKICSQQMDFATEIFEYTEKISYENVTEENLIKYINDTKALDSVKADKTIEEIETNYPEAKYKISIDIKTYSPKDEENLPKLDLVKTITLTIEYDLAGEPYSTTISKIRRASLEEVKNMLE